MPSRVTPDQPQSSGQSLFRRFSLGVDPAKGDIYAADEMKAALQIEVQSGVRLSRDPSDALEWFDTKGRSYDAMGTNLSAQSFDQQWALGVGRGLRKSLMLHLLKADFVPFAISGLRADQVQTLKDYIATLSQSDQVKIFFIGE